MQKTIIEDAVHEIDNPALSGVTCNPDYFRSLVEHCRLSLDSIRTTDLANPSEILPAASALSNCHSLFLVLGKAVSNSSPDITFGESTLSIFLCNFPNSWHVSEMADECKRLGQNILDVLEAIEKNEAVDEDVTNTLQQLNNITSLAEVISGSLLGTTSEILSDMIEGEMMAMDKAIEEAARQIQVIRKKLILQNEIP